MTEQEIFDRVWDHMQHQGGPALLPEDESCSYLTADGKMCAVGCLLQPKELEFAKEMEGGVFTLHKALSVHFGKTESVSMLGDNLNFLSDLQDIHDDRADCLSGSKYMLSFEEKMRNIATSRGLEMPK